MANEVVYSGTNLRAAAVLNREVYATLADMSDLRSVCFRMPFDGVGSTVLKVGKYQPNYAMAAPGEITAPANTAFVDSTYNHTIARKALQFEYSDLMQITAPDGSIDVQRLARIVAQAYGLTFTDDLAALFPSLSNSVGTSGVDMAVDDMYDAIFQLQASNASGPFTAVLNPVQVHDFMTSLRGETGSLSFIPATADQLSAKGPGYRGSWQGVDIWACDSVTANGGNWRGAMFDPMCFSYVEAPVASLLPAIDKSIAVAESNLLVTVEFLPTTALFQVIGSAYYSVAEHEDARGVLIATDQ